MLEFANPSGWWWLLAALPIVGFYILKVRLRRVPTSTLLFWNQLYDEKKPRSWWQQLRHWLSLLLQLAFLLLLIAALVDPLWSWQKQRQRKVVLVLDNSASMQASGGARFDEAKQAAATLVRTLREGDQMAIISAGGLPNVLWGMTNHQSWLLDAIEDLEPTDAPAQLAESVQLAERLLSGNEGETETIVLTDGQAAELEQLQKLDSVKIFGVGKEEDNLAITRYQVRRSLTDATGYQVLIDITNFSESPKECTLDLKLGDALVDVLNIKLEAGETITRFIDHASAEGGELIATIDADDGLAIDDQAVAILPYLEPLPVQLASQGNLFLASVLRSIPLVDLTIEEGLSQRPANAITVVDQKTPAELPAGPLLVVNPQENCQFWTMGEELEQPIVAEVDRDSPLTQHVRLDNVLFPGARKLTFTCPVEVLIADPFDNPLLARISRPGGDVVVLTCSLEKGDLPLRIAFPVLMKNTIEWFKGDAGVLHPSNRTGSVLLVNLDQNRLPTSRQTPPKDGLNQVSISSSPLTAKSLTPKQQFELVSPNGTTVPITSVDGKAQIGPLLKQGLWKIQASAETTGQSEEQQTEETNLAETQPKATVRTIACNLASTEESDLRFKAELPRLSDEYQGALLGGRSLWFYLTLLAVGFIAAEWWLYHRRIVG